MPDEWEAQHGLNANDANDRNNVNEEGYTMLEVYMNDIVEHITQQQYEGGTVMGDDNEDTGVTEICPHSVIRNDIFYTLQGVPAKHPSKGIYIINGKKIIVK